MPDTISFVVAAYALTWATLAYYAFRVIRAARRAAADSNQRERAHGEQS